MTLAAAFVRELDLAPERGGDGPAHVSAASGLAVVGGTVYVVADDEVGLGVFPGGAAPPFAPGRLVPLFEEVLPLDPVERKAAKPDLEALCVLDAGGAGRALLALGSGSADPRHRGVHWRLGADGALEGDPRPVELRPLYDALRSELSELNLEGATVRGDELLLANRGNGKLRQNAVVTLRLAPVLGAIEAGAPVPADAVGSIEHHTLPEAGGRPLTFSDLTTLPDGRVLFAAVGEDTDDPYEDGAFTGAAIGELGGALHALVTPVKVEGIAPEPGGGLLLTADPDDRAVPAPLLRAEVPGA